MKVVFSFGYSNKVHCLACHSGHSVTAHVTYSKMPTVARKETWVWGGQGWNEQKVAVKGSQNCGKIPNASQFSLLSNANSSEPQRPAIGKASVQGEKAVF